MNRTFPLPFSRRNLHPGASRLLAAGTAAALFLFAWAVPASGQVLTYTFNDPANGSTTANTGTGGTTYNLTTYNAAGTATDYHSSNSAGGVAFLDGSNSLNLTSATQMGGTGASPGSGPYAASATAGNVFNSSVSFTITGWYNTGVTTSWQSARFLQTGGLYVFAGAANNLLLELGNTTQFASNSGGTGSAFLTSAQVANKWTFLAVTYSASAGQIVFYQGVSGSNSLLSYTDTFTAAQTLGNVASLALGSSVASGSGNVRPFQGSFDNFNVYSSTTDNTGALSSAQVNTLYMSQNVVPEPSTAAMICLPLLAGALWFVRRSPRRPALA